MSSLPTIKTFFCHTEENSSFIKLNTGCCKTSYNEIVTRSFIFLKNPLLSPLPSGGDTWDRQADQTHVRTQEELFWHKLESKAWVCLAEPIHLVI